MTSQQLTHRLTDNAAGLLNTGSLALLQAEHYCLPQQRRGIVANLVAHVTQPAQQGDNGCTCCEHYTAVLVDRRVTLVLIVDPAEVQPNMCSNTSSLQQSCTIVESCAHHMQVWGLD